MLLAAVLLLPAAAAATAAGPSPACGKLDVGFMYSGSDIVPRVRHNSSDAAGCCQLCVANPQCNFFSFNSGKVASGSENCWLKTSDVGRRQEGNSISGGVGRVPPHHHHHPPSPSPGPLPPPPAPPGVRRACTGASAKAYKFCDTSLTPAERAADIVSRLTLHEKPNLMTARHSSAIDRLGIPAYDWGVNSIHGDQVSCGTHCATNYPLPTAIGATMNLSLVHDLANMMGVELRALRLEHACEDHRRRRSLRGSGSAGPLPDACIGLDTWAPNLNLNRDPRWGRNWEVATECPFLGGQIGKAYAQGFQVGPGEDGSKYLLGVITLKHWAACEWLTCLSPQVFAARNTIRVAATSAAISA